ncbi:hypothetical protein [Amycolatopsis sp. CA-128772]|uniref:hypothetical protein n=1 Tax=Amycolatopsis sp. CA-128772 TaxID=2073159 RepID=UPI0011B0F334|nr:hypothetical protein [Amycolatopsis sp. CA-128772]
MSTSAPPSVITDGSRPAQPYRSSVARQTEDGIATTPAAWVAFTARTSQTTHARPVSASSPSRLPAR